MVLVIDDCVVHVTFSEDTNTFVGKIPGLPKGTKEPAGNTIEELAEEARPLILMLKLELEEVERKKHERRKKAVLGDQ